MTAPKNSFFYQLISALDLARQNEGQREEYNTPTISENSEKNSEKNSAFVISESTTPTPQLWLKLSLHFYLSNAKQSTPSPIFAVIRIYNKVYKVRLGVKCLPSAWDKKAQLCIIQPSQNEYVRSNHAIANEKIMQFRQSFNEFLAYVCNQNNLYNLKELVMKEKIKIEKKNKSVNARELINAFNSYNASKSESTAKQCAVYLKRFRKYLSENEIKEAFENMTYLNIFNYARYLEENNMMYDSAKGYLNYVIKALKEFSKDPNINYDLEPKITQVEINKALDNRTYEDKAAKHLILSDEQIKAFKEVEIKLDTHKELIQEWELTRKLFILKLYTGIRISDFDKLLNPNNYTEIDGKPFIQFIDKKEGKRSKKPKKVSIPLINAEVDELWKALKDLDMNFIKKIATKERMNRRIKEIAKQSGAFNNIVEYNEKGKTIRKYEYELLSSHDSRHTFITNLGVNNGLSSEEISYITGHRNTQSIDKTYLHISEEANNKRVAKVVNKLTENNKKEIEKTNKEIEHRNYIPTSTIRLEQKPLDTPNNKVIESYGRSNYAALLRIAKECQEKLREESKNQVTQG